MTPEELKAKKKEYYQRWISKPGNRERHRKVTKDRANRDGIREARLAKRRELYRNDPKFRARHIAYVVARQKMKRDENLVGGQNERIRGVCEFCGKREGLHHNSFTCGSQECKEKRVESNRQRTRDWRDRHPDYDRKMSDEEVKEIYWRYAEKKPCVTISQLQHAKSFESMVNSILSGRVKVVGV